MLVLLLEEMMTRKYLSWYYFHVKKWDLLYSALECQDVSKMMHEANKCQPQKHIVHRPRYIGRFFFKEHKGKWVYSISSSRNLPHPSDTMHIFLSLKVNRDLMIPQGESLQIHFFLPLAFCCCSPSIDASYLSFTSISQPRGITNGGSKRVLNPFRFLTPYLCVLQQQLTDSQQSSPKSHKWSSLLLNEARAAGSECSW